MVTRGQLQVNFRIVGAEIIQILQHIPHNMEMCRWFYWNLKWPPQVDFLNICDRTNSNLIYGGGWYRTFKCLLLKSS